MKTGYGRSTCAILLLNFVALALIGHRIPARAQTTSGSRGAKTAFVISNIDGIVVKEFSEAWRLSRNGSDGFEGLVLIYPATDGSILARSQGKSSEQKEFTFGWTSNIIAVVHTHPNGVDPKPAGHDFQLADRFLIPVFTITKRGMYVYDPETRKTSMVEDGLDWLESAKWTSDMTAAGRRS